MRALHLVRPIALATITAASACTIWVALDDPYKSEQAGSVDAGSEATAPGHVVDAGFAPYAITAYGDSVYVVDNHARVHVAADGGTSFAVFAGGAGDVIEPTNRIAASRAGVFWTVDKGIRYCALDGGGCGLLPRGGVPTLIAAGDSVVAWKEAGDAGIGRCDLPLSQCAPSSVAVEPPTSLAVEPDGTVAYASGKQAIGFVGGSGPKSVLPVKGYAVRGSLLARLERGGGRSGRRGRRDPADAAQQRRRPVPALRARRRRVLEPPDPGLDRDRLLQVRRCRRLLVVQAGRLGGELQAGPWDRRDFSQRVHHPAGPQRQPSAARVGRSVSDRTDRLDRSDPPPTEPLALRRRP